jgi:ferredoxin
MKVSVDREKCVASGQCVLAAEAVFDQDENDGVVILRSENPSPDQHAAVRVAAEMCPASVITVTEDDS